MKHTGDTAVRLGQVGQAQSIASAAVRHRLVVPVKSRLLALEQLDYILHRSK